MMVGIEREREDGRYKGRTHMRTAMSKRERTHTRTAMSKKERTHTRTAMSKREREKTSDGNFCHI